MDTPGTPLLSGMILTVGFHRTENIRTRWTEFYSQRLDDTDSGAFHPFQAAPTTAPTTAADNPTMGKRPHRSTWFRMMKNVRCRRDVPRSLSSVNRGRKR